MEAAPALRRLGLPETAYQRSEAFALLRGLASPTFIIIDDYHLVTDPALGGFLDVLTLEALENLHLALFSRTRPEAIRLDELYVKRLAVVVEQNFLAFTEPEVEDYFKYSGIHDAAAVSEAWHYSEGWPAALWLCKQSWLNCGAIRTSDSIDSLMHTVFSAYDTEERDMLMCLSVLDSFTESDAAKVSAGPRSRARLRRLYEKNAFLLFDKAKGHYHLHGIFRDFLRKELACAPHINLPVLYRQAGDCCARRKEVVQAMRLLVRAGRDDDLKTLLDFFLRYDEDPAVIYFAEEVYQLVTGIPWRVRLQNPLGYMACVTLYAVMWTDHRAVTLLEEAEERLLNAEDMPEYLRKRLAGEFEVLRGTLAFNDMDAVWEHYNAACRLLNGPSVTLSQDTMWNFGSPNLAFLLLRKPGEYLGLLEAGERNFPAYLSLSGGIGKGGMTLLRAEHMLELGSLAGVEPLLWQVMRGCKGDKHMHTLLAGVFTMARLYIATGKVDEAAQALVKMHSQVTHVKAPEFFLSLDMAEGYVNGVLGRPLGIPRWLRDGEIFDPPHNMLPHLCGFCLTIHARALLLQKDYHRLAYVAGEIPACSPLSDSLFARIHSAALKGMAAWHTTGRTSAMQHIRTALDLARPDGIVLPLAEYGGHILPLLRRLKREGRADAHCLAVLAQAGRFAASTGHSVRAQRGLLTPREREVLRHVVEGMSNPAIAGFLGVSLAAVKKVLSGAFVKLGVTNRFEAKQRFIEQYTDKGDTVL